MKTSTASHLHVRVTRTHKALALALLAVLCGAAAFGAADATPASGALVTVAHATALEQGDVLLGTLPMTQPIQVVVSLKLRNKEALDAFVADSAKNPFGSVSQPMTSAQFLAAHAPTPAQAQAVANYLTQSGFTNVVIAPNRLLVSADGTALMARNAFFTTFAQVKTHDGRIAYANTDEARVPAPLGGIVLAVLGLQTVHQAHAFTKRQDSNAAQTNAITTHDPTTFPAIYSVGSAAVASDVPIGIVTEGDLTQTLADLSTFTTNHGLPAVSTSVVTVGSTGNDTTNVAEWDLDSQAVVGMAGGQVGKLIFYNVSSVDLNNFTTAYNQAVSDNQTKIIIASAFECEVDAGPPNNVHTADDAIFEAGVAQGQTFVAANGDTGADGCPNDGQHANRSTWPAASQYVVAAAGTRLNASSTTWTNETVWIDSGGAPSTFEPAPSWQGTTKRISSDVAFDADPSSGALVVVNGATTTKGGTALSASLFAGLWARVLHAHPTVGFAAPVIYKLPTTDFHDITAGINSGGLPGLGFAATVGYDDSSGRGSMLIGRTVTDVGTLSTQLLRNTGFENGTAPPWTFTPANMLTNNASLAHGGNWLAAVGGAVNATDTVSQGVAIPSGKSSATLRFYLHTITAETTTTLANDTLSVQVFGSGHLLGTLATYSNLNATTGYVEHDLDLHTYIGQTVNIKFAGVNNGSLPTTWDLDDVTLTVN